MRVGFAGAGNMAAAMARGWAAGPGGPEAMLFCDLDASAPRRSPRRWAARRATASESWRATATSLVLAVKPAALDEVAEELGGGRRR